MVNSKTPYSPGIQPERHLIEPISFKPHQPAATGFRPRFKRQSVLTLLLLAVYGCLAWFLFSAKAVYIKTTPEHADIDVSGILQLKLADRLLLLRGIYELQISAAGYSPLVTLLTVDEPRNQAFSYELARLPGHLRVATPGVEGAEIFIDGIARGTTPALIRDIPYGEHQLLIRSERYFPYETILMVEGLDREQAQAISLAQAWAEVNFASRPAGADVFVDEELLGQTPLRAGILKGQHNVRLKLNGYKPWQDHLTIVPSQTLDLTDIALEPADAVVYLVSNPPSANTTVDGEYLGLTPLELAITPGQTSTIKLYKQGYRAASRKITAASGDQLRMDVRLEPELVQVLFNISPPDAELFVDGSPSGAGPVTLSLPAREHQIVVRRAGYLDYNTRITPPSGVTQQLNIQLKTEAQAKLEQIKPVITTHAGQTLKLFRPDSFSMGASRREPGRRPNESLRNVAFKRAFYLGLHEVTNEQYRLMNPTYTSGELEGVSLNGDQLPVARVTWEQAAQYCNWLSRQESLPHFYLEEGGSITGIDPQSTGYRLPTEAEWEWAARAGNDHQLLKFPWGQAMPPTEKSGNFADQTAANLLGKILNNYNDGYLASAPVGSFPIGNNGLYDMGGNVAEWVNDYYGIMPGGNTVETDPLGPINGEFRVIKGSSWAHGTITELRLSYRDYGDKQRDDAGFRIARYLE